MLLVINQMWSHTLLFSILSLLIASVHSHAGIRRRSTSHSPRAEPRRRAGQARTIKIVTDTLLEGEIVTENGKVLYPAHSWVIFGSTAEEGPLRVELVSPTIDNVSKGLAISVNELLGDGEDIGDLTFPLPVNVERTTLTVNGVTKLRNADIFDPIIDPATNAAMASGRISPVLKLAIRNRSIIREAQLPLGLSGATGSHLFAEMLVSQLGAIPLIPLEEWSTTVNIDGENAIARGDSERWTYIKRFRSLLLSQPLESFYPHHSTDSTESLKLSHELGTISPVEHIFYEARATQPRMPGSPGRSSVVSILELDPVLRTDGSTSYKARRILDPWSNLLRGSRPSTFRHGSSIVKLSRDPHLTSGHLMPDQIGHLPLIFGPPTGLPTPAALPSSTSTSTSFPTPSQSTPTPDAPLILTVR